MGSLTSHIDDVLKDKEENIADLQREKAVYDKKEKEKAMKKEIAEYTKKN